MRIAIDLDDTLFDTSLRTMEYLKQIDKKYMELVCELAQKYAEIKNGNADELLKYYLNKNKVNSIEDLTMAQGISISKELNKLIERSSKQ